MKVIQKQPVLIAEVEMMPEEDDTSPQVTHHLFVRYSLLY